LDLLDKSLRAHHGSRVADGGLAALRRRVEVFGLHVAKLDVRVHASAVREPDERLRETLSTAARMQRRHGRQAVHRLIVSLTPSADDLAAADALARDAGYEAQVVPRFETIADLRNAPAVLGEHLERAPR